ncbi:MAG: hypothetical protein U0797_15460 [Gemmataceae bacterium]
MADKSHLPDDRTPWPELGDLVRASVERIRHSPPPPESLSRALERARRLGSPRPRPWLARRASLFAASAVAASLLVGLGLRYGPNPFAAPLDVPSGRGGDLALMGPGDLRLSSDTYGQFSPAPVPGGTLMLVPGRVANAGAPGDDYLTIGVAQVGSHWGAWEQVRALREVSRAMPQADRKAVEAYLRHQARPARRPAWVKDGRPLRQARIAQDGDGRELLLEGVKVAVRIEGPRARTLVQQVFYNPDDRPLTGTFEMAVPDGGSPSYFALFPGNKTNTEGATWPKDVTRSPAPARVALPTPEEAMKQVDPSCWGRPRVGCIVPVPAAPEEPADPGPLAADSPGRARATFRGPVGTILPRAHVCVLVAYEETLPFHDGRLVYRYPLPETKLYDLAVVVQADAALAPGARLSPGEGEGQTADGLVTYRRAWKNARPGEEVVFTAIPPSPAVQATSCKHGDGRYLVARLRPDVPAALGEAPFARHAVFLLDTSAGENAARVDRAVQLMRRVLETDASIAQFNVLTFSTGAAWLEPGGWLPNTQAGRDAALSRLDGVVLEGATDLSAAVEKLLAPAFAVPAGLPMHCFLLSEGRLSAGETDGPSLVARLEARAGSRLRWHCYQLGLGDENADLFALLTRAGGGVYRCPSEKDVPAAAQAHRRPSLRIDRVAFEGGPEATDVLVSGRRAAVYPGGDLVVAAQLSRAGPTTLVVEGHAGDRKVTQRFPVEVRDDGQLAGRAWGELAVSSLLALNDPRLEPAAVAIASRFRVASRATAFGLFADPRRWEAEPPPPPGHDLEALLDGAWKALGREATPQQRRDWLAAQLGHWVPLDAVRRDLRGLVAMLPERELKLPAARLQGGLTRRAGADPAYLAARRQDRVAIDPVLDEARRRLAAGEADAAARVLCGLAEEHAGNPDVARLVAYHLVATGRAALATHLLADQVEQRPHDPAAHRALAVALDEAGLPGRAALHFEVALALLGPRGGWVAGAREEFVFLLRRRLRDGQLPEGLRRYFDEQLARLDRHDKAPLQVSMTWNATASDVALRVTDAAGKAVQAPGRKPTWSASWPGRGG